ncbi:DUF1835 domain-containing protein [Halobacillus fulvus]|nr:DUF1835 domain-containing protein [Halobacillus fulvus]
MFYPFSCVTRIGVKRRKQMSDLNQRWVKSLEEEELQSFVKLIFHQLDYYKTTTLSAEQVVDRLLEWKERALRSDDPTENREVHIAFDDSVAGALRIGLPKHVRVLSFSDQFSIGPIDGLDQKEGMERRKRWLEEHINIDEETLFVYTESFLETLNEIRNIPDEMPIFVWLSDNSHEQTGAAFVDHLLSERQESIAYIHSVHEYDKHFEKVEGYPVHTGEIAPDKLRVIYEETSHFAKPVQRWSELEGQHTFLRIWCEDRVEGVAEDHFDDLVLNTIDHIQSKRKEEGYIKAARVIGELIGHLDQVIGDSFFEYRLRTMAFDGKLSLKGVPKSMRFYEVQRK